MRALATRERAALPHTGRVCVSYSLKWTDDYVEKWDESRQAITRQRGSKVNLEYMAMECMTYTAE